MIETADSTKIGSLTVHEFVSARAKTQDVAAGVSVNAYVNHGRWVVDCPFCNSAQLASKSDRKFFCIQCLNAQVGGLWLAVTWPVEEAAIEAELLKRDNPEKRNWHPGETLSGLKAEYLSAMGKMLDGMDKETLEYLAAQATAKANAKPGGKP